MRKLLPLALALLTFLAAQSSALARGRGVRSFLLTNDGQLAATLGETSGDLLDPAGFSIYRYREGRITAAPLDKPDKVLWSAAAKPVLLYDRDPLWHLVPDVLVIFGEETITGIDRANGKVLYETGSESFTRNSSYFKYFGQYDTPPVPTLYLIDAAAQAEDQLPNEQKPTDVARLARFDLRRGKFLWKADIVTAAGMKIRPSNFDLRGAVHGQAGDDSFYFDPATGKALDKLLDSNGLSEFDPFSGIAIFKPGVVPKPGELYLVNTSADKIVAEDFMGKKLWGREEPGVKGRDRWTSDSILIPIVTDRTKVHVLALNKKDGSERWRCTLPLGHFADQVTVSVDKAKTGYLVHVEWTVLD